jgi:hypothetical protein
MVPLLSPFVKKKKGRKNIKSDLKKKERERLYFN